MKTLQLKDISGYLPYGLFAEIEVVDEKKVYKLSSLSINGGVVLVPCCKNKIGFSKTDLCEIIPVLRPVSDLYRTITHNGKEIIPIVELAKIAYPNTDWDIVPGGASITGYDFIIFYFASGSFLKRDGGVANQYKLFDYLHELKIDYRGLINAGLAIDVNTLEYNPYK